MPKEDQIAQYEQKFSCFPALPMPYVHKIGGKIIHPSDRKITAYTKSEVPNGNIQKSYRTEVQHNP
jgi:hypothetical protein